MQKPTFNKITKIWSGPKVLPIFNPDQNLGQLILKVLEQTSETVAQISADTKVSVTCGQMRERTEKFAKYLNSLGLKQDDVVGIVAANTENLAPSVFACFLLGLPFNPLAPIMIESDIVHMFGKTKPKLIICDGNNLKIVQNGVNMMKSNAKIITVMEDVENYDSVTKILNRAAEKDFDYPEVDSNSAALILCSSGSISVPKVIFKTHKEILSIRFPISQNQICYVLASIFWYSGFSNLINSVLFKLTRVITAQPYNPQYFVDILSTYGVNMTLTPPFILVNLYHSGSLKRLDEIKTWIVSGAKVSEEIVEKCLPFIPNGIFLNCYGSSEANLISINNQKRKYESSGFLVQNIDIKIVDENGNSLDYNQQGEICIKRSVPFLGYLDEPEKTKEAYDGEWFKTGDIGYFDDEDFFYIIDRKKEILIYQGFLTTPSELEAIINEIDGVMSSCVVGVHQESIASDIIYVFVIVDKTKNLTVAQIENFFNLKVKKQRQLQGGVHFLENFPLTASEKVNRMKIKEMAKELMA
ncbi:hypothetical protein PVAND_017101 [Polypedilum vanderplanki]|uniref:Uncharacterized protein n=1 Tax=Polypedilum vanderplanki TaxID=319348 RepID=A0A9J6BHR9_POLVA|nr:hypothetical protein PVAND_017101 [Polypedilum vanderplanki]